MITTRYTLPTLYAASNSMRARWEASWRAARCWQRRTYYVQHQTPDDATDAVARRLLVARY